MKIYFIDGKINEDMINSINPQCMVIDASNGVSHCRRCLDFAMTHPHTTMVLTNSLLALDNKYVWNDKINVPELFVQVSFSYYVKNNYTSYTSDCIFNGWERIDRLTDRQLNEGHNLMKLYLAGEFDEE